MAPTDVGPMCSICKDMPCVSSYPDGIPTYCPAAKFPEIIEKTRIRGNEPEINRILIASRRIAMPAAGQYWPRIEEGILFARQLDAKNVGLAACIGFMREAKDIVELFRGAGLQMHLVNCHVGGVHLREWRVPEENWGPRPTGCNPLAQAEILNELQTEINFMLGFCIGCDGLFVRYAKALSTTLAVKDKVTGHNPCAVLNNWYHRSYLWQKYCKKETPFSY